MFIFIFCGFLIGFALLVYVHDKIATPGLIKDNEPQQATPKINPKKRSEEKTSKEPPTQTSSQKNSGDLKKGNIGPDLNPKQQPTIKYNNKGPQKEKPKEQSNPPEISQEPYPDWKPSKKE